MALYPPVVASSMPAFNVNLGKVKIYYTLSSYNSIKKNDITTVHVSVRRQSSNVNVLNNANEIVEKSFGQQLETDKILNRYFVEISNSDLKEKFEKDAVYKVQLRFSSVSFSESFSTQEANFYSSNIASFSLWSTVCLIKPILVPIFYIDEFHLNDNSPPELTDTNNFYSTLSDFTGVYKQQSSLEALKSWRLRLLSGSYSKDNILSIENYVLCDSGWVLNSANNYNTSDNSVILACSLPYELKEDVTYKLLFEIRTKNGYESSVLYTFVCNNQSINTLVGELKSYINEEEGYVKLTFSSSENNIGNLVIRRTDARSNFLKWEDLKFLEYYNIINFVYYDFTVLSGTFYRYLIQKVDPRGRRGTPLYDSSRANGTGIMVEWEHPFLLLSTGNGDLVGTKQLKLKYDFQISSYKTNISESKTDTIGSKYPFIRRNGSMYYRSFPISGTITGYMDEANLFTNLDELFDNKLTAYKDFKGLIGECVNRYDYTYERKFREKVELFLYNSKPKLYKSMQLGNIFIKLMDISLIPKNELGRLVYNFSATAYEVDLACIQTYNNYGLITVGVFNPNVVTHETKIKQLTTYDFNNNIKGKMFKAGFDIIGEALIPALNTIAKSLKYNESFNRKITTDFEITWLRLTIESEPYLIVEYEDGRFRPYDDIAFTLTDENGNYHPYNSIDKIGPDPIEISDPIKYRLYQMLSTYKNKNIDSNINVYLGWLFEIVNDNVSNQIIVSYPNNIYELKLDTFSFNKFAKIIPAKDTAMLVDFRVNNLIEEDLSDVPKNIRINKVNGQLMGTYTLETEIISRINYKYKYKYERGKLKIVRDVNGVNTVLVDALPGTIIKLKTKKVTSDLLFTSELEQFIINETGELKFDPNDPLVYIKSLRIIGRNIIVDNKKYLGTQTDLTDLVAIEGNYTIVDDKLYYYYNNEWIEALWDEGHLGYSLNIKCPVDALIFYYAFVRERTF